jgi:hypothetical protein
MDKMNEIEEKVDKLMKKEEGSAKAGETAKPTTNPPANAKA